MFNNPFKSGLTFFSGGVALGGVPLDSRENLQSSKQNWTRSVKNTAWKTILSFWNGPLSRGQLVRFLDCKARCYPIRGRCFSGQKESKKWRCFRLGPRLHNIKGRSLYDLFLKNVWPVFWEGEKKKVYSFSKVFVLFFCKEVMFQANRMEG